MPIADSPTSPQNKHFPPQPHPRPRLFSFMQQLPHLSEIVCGERSSGLRGRRLGWSSHQRFREEGENRRAPGSSGSSLYNGQVSTQVLVTTWCSVNKPRSFRPGPHYPDLPSPGSFDAMLVLRTTQALTSIRSFTTRRVHSAMALTPLYTPTLRLTFTAPWKTMRTRYGPPRVTNIG